MPTLVIACGAFFMAMFLMRMTLRQARRERPDGLRWRGIDWSGVKLPEKPEGESKTEGSPRQES